MATRTANRLASARSLARAARDETARSPCCSASLSWPSRCGRPPGHSRRDAISTSTSRVRPALRPRRPPPVVAALPHADHAALRGRLARRLRRAARGAAHGAALCRLDRLLGRSRPLLRAVGRHHSRRLPARLPGLRADVPRALERARVRRRIRGLGTARRQGRIRSVREPLRPRGPRRRPSRTRAPGKRRAARVRRRPAPRRRARGGRGSNAPARSSSLP